MRHLPQANLIQDSTPSFVFEELSPEQAAQISGGNLIPVNVDAIVSQAVVSWIPYFRGGLATANYWTNFGLNTGSSFSSLAKTEF